MRCFSSFADKARSVSRSRSRLECRLCEFDQRAQPIGLDPHSAPFARLTSLADGDELTGKIEGCEQSDVERVDGSSLRLDFRESIVEIAGDSLEGLLVVIAADAVFLATNPHGDGASVRHRLGLGFFRGFAQLRLELIDLRDEFFDALRDVLTALVDVEKFGFELADALILFVEIATQLFVSHERLLVCIDEGGYDVLEPIEVVLVVAERFLTLGVGRRFGIPLAAKAGARLCTCAGRTLTQLRNGKASPRLGRSVPTSRETRQAVMWKNE
jgi:hypothetical protein